MDKKYLLSDGRTKIVPLDFEQEFLKQLEEQNLTAELITDEPGKSLGTSLSQNNQQLQINEDMGIDLATGEVISKQQQEATGSKSEDGSLESLRLDFESIGKELKESDYENKLSNLNNAIEKSIYQQEKNALINQYNNTLKEYQDKLLVQKNIFEKYNKAVDNIDTQTGKTKDNAYFTANEFNLNEIKNIYSKVDNKDLKPLEYKIDKDGRRLYYTDQKFAGHGYEIEPGWHKEVKYDYDRSLGVRFEHDSYGQLLDDITYGAVVVAHALPGLKDKKERQRTLEFLQNRIDNIPENLVSPLISASTTMADYLANAPQLDLLGKRGLLGKDYEKKKAAAEKRSEDFIINAFEQLDKMEIGGEGIKTPLGTLKRKDTGVGIVEGAKMGSASDIIAGAFGATMSMVETAVPAYFTWGYSLPVQVAAPMYTEYNREKARYKYGNDPEAIEKLVRNGETEIALPIGLGFVATSLEWIGLKGVDDYIRNIPGKGKKLASLLWTGNKEGFTEVAQLGVETINKELGGGKDAVEASKMAWDAMTSDEGFEMWLNGFIGSTTISATGSTLNRALRGDDNTAQNLNNYIDKLQELNTRKHIGSNDDDVKESIDLEIKEVEENIKKLINNSRGLKDYLSEDQKTSLVDILNQKDEIKNKVNSLKSKLKNNEITQKEFNLAIQSLANKDKILSDEVFDIKKQAIEAAAKRTIESVKKQITDMGLEGTVTEMTSEEISKLDEEGFDSKGAAASFGFIKQQPDGSFEIILNKDKPMIGTAAHEFMHAILFKTLGGNSELQTSLGDALQQHVTTLGGDLTSVGRRLSRYGKWQRDKDGNITGFKKDANFGEETITIMSESILDGSLEFNEGFFTKIGDIIRRFSQNYLGKEIRFDTGRDVYNFIKDYNNSIKTGKVNKAIVKVAKEGAKGELLKKKVKPKKGTTIQESRGALIDDINQMQKGATTKAEFQSENVFTPIFDSVTNSGGAINNYIKSLGMSPDKTRETINSVANRLANYNPETQRKTKTGEPITLGEFIMANVGFAKKDAAKKLFQEGKKKEREVRGDIVDDTGRTVFERTDTESGMSPEDIMIAEEEAMAAKEKLAKASKETLEKKLGLDKKADKEFEEALVIAFGTKLPEVDSKKLRTELRKIVADKLRPKIQKLFGREESYNDFIKNDLSSLLGFIKVDDLIQMERLVGGKKFPNGRKVLASSRRVTSVKEVRRLQAMDPPLIDRRIKPATGPSLKTRLKPTSKELLAVFRGLNAEKILGYQPPGSMDSGMLGARKDRLAELLTGEIAFNKAIQIAEQQIEKIQAIEEIQNRNIKENYIAELGLTLDRDPTIQYSKDTVVEQVDLLENLVSELGIENVIKDGKLLEGLPIMSKAAIQMVEKLYDNNVIMSEPAKAFKQSIFKSDIIPESLKNQYRAVGNLRFNDVMLDLMHGDSSTIALELGSEILDVIGYEILGYKNRTMDPAKQKKDGSKGRFYDRLINLKNRVGKKKVKLPAGLNLEDVRMMNKSFPLFRKIEKILALKSKKEKLKKLKALKPEIDRANIANIKLAKHIASTIIKLAKKGKINPITALNILQSQTSIVQGFRGLSRLDLIDVRAGSQTVSKSHPQYKQALTYYKNKGVKNPEAKALERVGSKGEHLAPNSNTMRAIAELIYKKDVNVDSELDLILAKHSQLLTSKFITDVIDDGPGGKTSTADFNRIKYLKKSDINNIVSADGRSYQDILGDVEINSMQLKFVNNIIVQQSKPFMVKKAQDNIYKFSKDNKTKGMSTFDFDETLIIDGENFVVATDPKTGEKINIKSGNWPTKGPELAAQGYKFNFDDFVNVRGGVDGPLLQKMKNQIEKYGPENVFVLTARPQTADIAIHEWLKSKDINIPFKNITGLADSKGQAKADWMIEKFAEGYNDMYFVDDALPNVEAVKSVLEQLDIKSKVVQAKVQFSKDGGLDFDKILEQSKGVDGKRRFSAQEARKMGIGKGRLKFFVPPSAEDFKGLVYSFLGRGREGDAHAAWFKEKLFDPFAKGIREWNSYKQAMSDDYQAVKKQFKNVGKILNDKVPGTVFTNDNAIRVYLWDKAGYNIPGLDLLQQKKLARHVNNNPDLRNFADALSVISRVPEGYIKPEGYWVVQTIASDLSSTVLKSGRKDFLAEWIENKNIIFSEENLNKIEAIYGTDFRDALENMLHRMETGTNRPAGKSKHVNMWLDWINGSVAATMFWNIRSAALQTISTVNFINMSDNNMFKAAAAFANQLQFWKDFVFIFNSPMLKQRRAGLQIDVSASEITRAFNEGKSRPEAILAYLLEKGFKPTQAADSFAISMGGATFYRNRINTYLKKGMSRAEAEKQAWLDFQEIAEETQQSSRPDLISMQQAGPMGRLILAWQNTPMQMTRLTKKALSDLVKRRRTPGYNQIQSDMGNISSIIYYGIAQNLIFGALQTGLMFLLFGWDEDEERKKKLELRTLNGALDTLLRGTGIYGAAVSTLKNVLLKWKEEREGPAWKRDDWNIAQEAINLSPPIGSKMRKLMGAIRTEKYNPGVSKEIGFRIENPNLSIAANWTEALLNIPVARVVSKTNNVEEALNSNNDIWQRVALVSGWSRWSVGVEDEELKAAKEKVKEKKKKEKDKGKVRCTAIKKSGGRCKNTTRNKNKKCYAHQ